MAVHIQIGIIDLTIEPQILVLPTAIQAACQTLFFIAAAFGQFAIQIIKSQIGTRRPIAHAFVRAQHPRAARSIQFCSQGIATAQDCRALTPQCKPLILNVRGIVQTAVYVLHLCNARLIGRRRQHHHLLWCRQHCGGVIGQNFVANSRWVYPIGKQIGLVSICFYQITRAAL